MKKRALFFLNRIISGLEDERFILTPKEMASAAIPYDRRQKMNKIQEEKLEKTQSEYEAMTWIQEKIKELPDDEG